MPFDGAAFAAALSSDKATKPPNWPVNRYLVGDEWGWFWDRLFCGWPYLNGGSVVQGFGKHHDLAPFTGVTPTTTQEGLAILGDGSEGTGIKTTIEITDTGYQTAGTKFTVFTRQEYSSSVVSWKYLMGGRDAAASNKGWHAYINTWTPGFVLNGVAAYNATAETTNQSVGVPFTMEYSLDINTNITFYEDGVQLGDTLTIGIGKTAPAGTKMCLAARIANPSTFDRGWKGPVSALYLIEGHLSASERAQLNRDPFGPFRPDMAKLLPMLIKAPVAGGSILPQMLQHGLYAGSAG